MDGQPFNASIARTGSEGTSSFPLCCSRNTGLALPGLKVTASFDRSESYTRVIDGQVRCITPEVKPQNLQVIWNVQFITVFVPAWMIPPVNHSLCRESIKTASSTSPIGIQSVRPTWFEDTTPKDTTPQPNQDPQGQQPQPLHGLKLVIKEVLPTNDQPEFPSLELLAVRGLLAPDTWKCKRAQATSGSESSS